MTERERAAVRDLQARLRVAEARIRYLERDKTTALRRTQKFKNQARYWHGVALHKFRPDRFPSPEPDDLVHLSQRDLELIRSIPERTASW